MTDEEAAIAMLIAMQAGDPKGTFCCPICFTWYLTSEEKGRCMTERHGYETINIGYTTLQ